MTIFELKCEAYLKNFIELKESFDILSKYINFSIYQSKELDLENIIRSINKVLIEELEYLLCKNINNSYLQVVSTQKKEIKQYFIKELYSATPVIITDRKDERGKQLFWSLYYNGDILSLQKKLQNNLEKKLKYFYQEELVDSKNFIQEIELKNQKPQSIYFKTTKDKKERIIRLLGNKLRIVPNSDDISQKLAFLSLAVGLGEKSSLGGGFCLGKGA